MRQELNISYETILPEIKKTPKQVYEVSTTLPGFHHLENVNGNKVWFVFDNKAPRDILIEL